MDTLVIVFVFAALLLGGLIGWFFGGRPVKDLQARYQERDTEAKELADRLSRMAPELATMSDRAARADALAEKLDRANEDLTGLKAQAAGFAEQKRLLEESREKLLKEFENTGAAVLGKAQEAFLARANERFGQSEEKSEARLKSLLEPVGKRLKDYEDQVSALEAKRVDSFGQLTGLIETMRRGQEEVRREAQRLGNSLTNAPKARGRWGERALQNVLEQCGLSQHTDFILEHSVDTADGRLRPDAIVNVPGQKKLVIDAKVSLNAYQEAFEADDDDVRKTALAAHAKSMRNHVQTLGAKSYQSQFDDAPDYVVMFVPGEHFVAAALEADPELWDFAFQNGVLLASPTNLVAIARTVAQVWRQDTIAQEAVEIGKAGAELYERLAVAAGHLKRMGSGLETAVGNYNKFVGSFERNVLSSGKRLAEKGIEIGKREIEEVPLVEGAPRYTASDVKALEDGGEKSDGDNETKLAS
ncbi:DNA recombination protein RmuC like protein [Alteripontixanthobacter maritimus]|uniref:DNA recombination protein RmuC homolog n=1 Tax=Alteripontixanthobacter maritimus TaxID=2161824 RepID=A0A369Q7Y5_9SPHN|nr:DNA recombination protein RmuC [Alteripontixanthobacter maritimus]RDC60572.1 DNA recombination protein RmuC like protein [Alteripontixanthobacter maritimus]